MACPPAPKSSLMRHVWQVLAGVVALASLMALFFVILQWRVTTPEEHLVFGQVVLNGSPDKNSE